MSRYRDDTQETAVASSSTWVRLKTVAEEIATITSTLIFSLLVLHTDAAAASDAVFDRAGNLVTEQAAISDTVTDSLHAAVLVAESAAATDRLIDRLSVLHTDSATASDAALDQVRAIVVERATLTDTVLATRHVFTLVAESARITDGAPQAATALVVESATASDWAGGKQHSRVLVVETAALSEQFADAHKAASLVLEDRAKVADAVLDHLTAHVLVIESALIEDQQVTGLDDAGQAWTANADTWAMSRYAPFTFDSLAVVNGVLYGFNKDGVYALDSSAETIAGSITTGKVDVGRGALAHPQSAYLNYELDGTAELDVTTTQEGVPATYTYPLELAPAGSRTNGRFKLGLGLRGSHFAFVLRLNGARALINNFSVQAAPTKRRV